MQQQQSLLGLLSDTVSTLGIDQRPEPDLDCWFVVRQQRNTAERYNHTTTTRCLAQALPQSHPPRLLHRRHGRLRPLRYLKGNTNASSAIARLAEANTVLAMKDLVGSSHNASHNALDPLPLLPALTPQWDDPGFDPPRKQDARVREYPSINM